MRTDELANSPINIGVLHTDPAQNPAVIDTGTWDAATALAAINQSPIETLDQLGLSVLANQPLPAIKGIMPYPGSVARTMAAAFVMAGLDDGQHVLLAFSREGQPSKLSGTLEELRLSDGRTMAVYPTDAVVLHEYLRGAAPAKGPRKLGATPRLGVGVRMTTACWPAVFKAMETHGFAANAIQNSIRELNFLSDILEGAPADTNYASGFGTIETGYTGSTIEGLWVSGVLEALKYPGHLRFGADADHIQVKRGTNGMSRAKRYLQSYRYYTFFTVDMADILDYAALMEPSDAAASDRARAELGHDIAHRDVVAYHRRPQRVGRRTYQLAESLVDRMIGKYWRALNALDEIDNYVRGFKNGEGYDLEFTIDEHPPEVAAFDCLTSDEECLFVVNELRRRGVPVTHLAPNIGIEKGFDYRGTDGLDAFEKRMTSLTEITAAGGMLIDVHSADDLTAPTRAAIRRATGGRLHYKISPMPQIVFASVLAEVHPDLFLEWWRDAVSYARDEATAGSAFASKCLEELESNKSKSPSWVDSVFHHFSFRFVGRRDPQGQYINRERFYSLSSEFYRVHQDRLARYLGGLADELLA